jgi:nanoRNase/pAp phosphatase (c-di-AMP/oligoRNAs hydrolase)
MIWEVSMSSKKNQSNPEQAKGVIKSPRERVQTFLKLFNSRDHVLITINPDPDSMASALAVRRLLWKRVRRAQIAYINEIQRLDNLAMVELLRIPMVKLSDMVPEDYSRKVLVDSQPDHSEDFASFKYDAIIDHHPNAKKWDAPYVDIRPGYGATTTILIEYLRAAGIKPSMKLATALLYGIKTDTVNFERRGTENDVKQFQYVFQYANMHRLRKIEKAELKVGDLRYFQTAIKNRRLTKKGIYAHLGRVPHVDICVQVADFFTRIHGVPWIIVSGIAGDELIVIFRNDGLRKDAGHLAKRAFGDLGHAGGHEGAARAEIPLDVLQKIGIRGYGAGVETFIRKRLKF